MKKILSFVLLLLMMLCSLVFSGCSLSDNGEASEKVPDGMLLFQPTYVGEDVTDTRHTFSKKDFKVTAFFANNKSEEYTDFTFEVVDLKDGRYTIDIVWRGMEDTLYVPLKMAIYPSETTGE